MTWTHVFVIAREQGVRAALESGVRCELGLDGRLELVERGLELLVLCTETRGQHLEKRKQSGGSRTCEGAGADDAALLERVNLPELALDLPDLALALENQHDLGLRSHLVEAE